MAHKNEESSRMPLRATTATWTKRLLDLPHLLLHGTCRQCSVALRQVVSLSLGACRLVARDRWRRRLPLVIGSPHLRQGSCGLLKVWRKIECWWLLWIKAVARTRQRADLDNARWIWTNLNWRRRLVGQRAGRHWHVMGLAAANRQRVTS